MLTLKVAIIGMGVMGKNHYRILKTFDNIQIVGLCDPLIDAKAYLEPCYTNVDDLLEFDFDIAFIVTPTFLHKEMALKCIQKNVHLFIEKPVTSTVAEGLQITKALQDKPNLKVAIGYIERFNPVVRTLKQELIDKDIYTINITRVGPLPPRIADVGVLNDLSVHDIDLLRFITGQNISKSNIFKSKKMSSHYEDNAVLSFIMDNDIICNINTNWLTPYKKRVIEISTDKSFFEADLMGQNLSEYFAFEGTHSYNTFAVKQRTVQKSEPLLNELKAFFHFIQSGDIGYLASIEDSLETIKVLEQ